MKTRIRALKPAEEEEGRKNTERVAGEMKHRVDVVSIEEGDSSEGKGKENKGGI